MPEYSYTALYDEYVKRYAGEVPVSVIKIVSGCSVAMDILCLCTVYICYKLLKSNDDSKEQGKSIELGEEIKSCDRN
ncbi:hypothetical protein L596_019383 [Steinernema carpocapsae]|uniref:Uncharacterized protein n=1 Tax=Steinernema carpocapsae TaxID=34508 RepID=A0A4U5MQD2_STECR|nr:hypothetical protein L596_019383 [Steinernema carpocapsae]